MCVCMYVCNPCITQIFVAKGLQLVPKRGPHIVIPTQRFAQSRNPDGYSRDATSRTYFNSEFRSNFPLGFRIPTFK